ncbi:MAG TPA: hypothetical protein VMY35_09780 [Phycisphaerae bacterium]|nr:hypothetical protein [Phycisphaerae bacterium]
MEKLCKTCKWWVKKDISYHGQNPNKCGNPKVSHESDRRLFVDGPCGKMVPVEEPLEDDCVDLCDASGYYAAMLPGPEYGCIHWESKG